MPLESTPHHITARMLDENYAVEYDHDNGYLAIILLPSSRINMIPQTAQALSDFLNGMDASTESREELSLEYAAGYVYGLLVLRKGAMRVPFSVQATQALSDFLNEVLPKQEEKSADE